MAFYKKASKGLSPGYHPYTRENIKHAGWCLNNNIKIAVIPNGTDWQVELNINNNTHLDPRIYKDKEAMEKIYEYYKYYYDKHNK